MESPKKQDDYPLSSLKEVSSAESPMRQRKGDGTMRSPTS